MPPFLIFLIDILHTYGVIYGIVKIIYIFKMGSKLSKRLSVLFTFVLMSVLFVNKAFAQSAFLDNYELPGPEGDLIEWILKIINWLIGASALVAVVMIVVSGFKYITANGDENRISQATKTLTYSIVGLVLCFIAGMIVNFVIGTFLE
ncbi:MAG: hypothetical protein UR61_C0009G0005 [candidate division WS6 bacterium GW2011_GWE1_34_7]|uniref:Uncharacterized protein n=1 Tax=candidate division WS6 bacterium GW2011_GWE1_34_7 TaxID=1619093 RepID=A0A0G0B914_9BACT|nr:MAG: hypothetical protein UR61_C0009G0005 [candidate division WS6 bacterium GW2011_GWE1_34_7]